METSILTSARPRYIHLTTLHAVAESVITTFTTKAGANKNQIVNDIPGDLMLCRDPQVIASVLGGLLSLVVARAKDCSVRLSVKTYGTVFLIHLRVGSSFCCNTFETGLQKLQPLVERIHGSLGLTSNRNNISTITFSFPNLPY